MMRAQSMQHDLRSRSTRLAYDPQFAPPPQPREIPRGSNGSKPLTRTKQTIWTTPVTSSRLLLPLLVIYCIIVVVIVLHCVHLVPPSAPYNAPPNEFSEARAAEHLLAVAAFGSRNTGSVNNEVHTVRYIVSQLSLFRSQLPAGLTLDISIDRPSGHFDLDFLGGFTSKYVNVTNIAARLHFNGDGIDRTAISFLMSAHFDSGIGTTAVSDDLSNIVNMLEMLRALIHSPPLSHAIIFLFNGAEETILQASHGFITQHPWAPTIAAFMNAESAGGTGRELVFQTGPKHSWLGNIYGHVAKYPFASSLAQEIFQSGVIPSDTDFRQYRDYGRIPGLDIAYIANGYIYHTAIDDIAHVVNGSLQRAGENMLAVIKAIGNAPELVYAHKKYRTSCPSSQTKYDKVRPMLKRLVPPTATDGDKTRAAIDAYTCDLSSFDSDAVFIDILGLYQVQYSARTGSIINAVVLMCAFVYLITLHGSTQIRIVETAWKSVVLLGCFLSGVLVAVMVGAFLVLTRSLSWYSATWLVFGLFMCPALAAYITLVHRWMHTRVTVTYHPDENKDKLIRRVNVWRDEEQTYMAVLNLWTILLAILTLFEIKSAIVFAILISFTLGGRSFGRAIEWSLYTPIANPTINPAVILTTKPPAAINHTWIFVISHIFGCFLPISMLLYAVDIVTFLVFIPILGRSGISIAPDIVVAVLSSFGVLFVASIIISFSFIDRQWRIMRTLFLACFLVSFFIALFISPYSTERPKRMFMQHTSRHYHAAIDSSILTSESLPLNISAVDMRTDSGIWMNALDWNALAPIRSLPIPQHNVADAAQWPEDTLSKAAFQPCEGTYCNLPWYYPFRSLMVDGWYIPTKPPPKPLQLSVKLTQVELIPDYNQVHNRHRRRLHFDLVGSHHITMYIEHARSNERKARLLRWSFHTPINATDVSLGPYYSRQSSAQWRAREDYFIYFASGAPFVYAETQQCEQTSTSPSKEYIKNIPADLLRQIPDECTLPLPTARRWSFWLEVCDNDLDEDDNEDLTAEEQALRRRRVQHPLLLAISSHYLDHTTPQINALQPVFPSWTTVVAWTSIWHGYSL